MAKKTKKVAVSSRGSKQSVLAEEKHVGKVTIDWDSLPSDSYDIALRDTLRHYNYFYDIKEHFKWAAAWVKSNLSKEDYNAFKSSPERLFSSTAGCLCKIMSTGGKITDRSKELVLREVKLAISRTSEKKEAIKPISTAKKSIAEIINERTSDFIADTENALDEFFNGGMKQSEYSAYNQLKSADAPAQVARGVIKAYAPLKEELELLLSKKKDEELEEGYANLTLKQRKAYLKLVASIVDDSERYLESKKAMRKAPVRKKKSAASQILKLKYAKESAEFKVTSVDPNKIIGASRVMLFDVKNRLLIMMESSSKTGFEIKGTTIQNVDSSVKKKIRKPLEVLPLITKSTKAGSLKQFSKINSKQADTSARVNENMIILKTFS